MRSLISYLVISVSFLASTAIAKITTLDKPGSIDLNRNQSRCRQLLQSTHLRGGLLRLEVSRNKHQKTSFPHLPAGRPDQGSTDTKNQSSANASPDFRNFAWFSPVGDFMGQVHGGFPTPASIH
jgi:hypothetical protein